MKKHILFFLLISFQMITIGQETKKAKLKYDPKKETYQAEAACGMCIYKMKGDGCKLAIRMNQKDFLVDNRKVTK